MAGRWSKRESGAVTGRKRVTVVAAVWMAEVEWIWNGCA